MDAFSWGHALSVARLGLPIALGVAAGAVGLFPQPKVAVDILNRYALYVAFPALVVVGLLRPGAELPGGAAFWLLWPAVLGVVLLGLRLWPMSKVQRATLGAATSFGNVAYLGLPYVASVMGPSIQGAAALAVAAHVTGAVVVGPSVLALAGAGQRLRAATLRVLRLPLFWAPLVGLSLRWFAPRGALAAERWLQPIASSAAAVALFVLGLHLHTHRGRARTAGAAVWGVLAVRLLVAPGLALGLALALVQTGWLTPVHGRLHVLLAAMPLAITTFSMAQDAGVGEDRIAAGIVVSTLAALVVLPLWWWVCVAVLPG